MLELYQALSRQLTWEPDGRSTEKYAIARMCARVPGRSLARTGSLGSAARQAGSCRSHRSDAFHRHTPWPSAPIGRGVQGRQTLAADSSTAVETTSRRGRRRVRIPRGRARMPFSVAVRYGLPHAASALSIASAFRRSRRASPVSTGSVSTAWTVIRNGQVMTAGGLEASEPVPEDDRASSARTQVSTSTSAWRSSATPPLLRDDGDHRAPDARVDEALSAGRCAVLMIARLQDDDGGRAGCERPSHGKATQPLSWFPRRGGSSGGAASYGRLLA
jgi:hypothetical protein